MKKTRFWALLLVVVLVVGNISYLTLPTAAADKPTIKRTIAIVFDNSGSMYANEDGTANLAWCQAQYAMEVFASMMNDSDSLMIYPMAPISVGKNSKEYSYQNDDPLVIPRDAKASDIRNIQSHHKNGNATPIESIEAAYAGLKKQSGEKWLIVLTDGAEFYIGSDKLSPEKTKTELEKRLGSYIKDVNICYLGIGTGLKKPEISGGTNIYAAKTANSAQVPSVLTEMCNMIFGRDELPKTNYSENSVNFDIPLSKLYVFIQGKDIDKVKLSSGGKSYTGLRSYQPKYGELGCDCDDRKVKKICRINEPDTSLQGYIAVYSNLDAGQYDFNYSGQRSSIAFYYEPDADLKVNLVNSAGKSIDSVVEVAPGEYYLEYELVDKAGNKLESSLLGKTNYELTYSLDGKKQTKKATGEGKEKVYIGANSNFSVDLVQVEFLSGYVITKRGSDDLGFLSSPFNATKGEAKSFEIAINAGESNYAVNSVVNGLSYLITCSYDGKTLSGEELDSVKMDTDFSSDKFSCDKKKENSGFRVQLTPKAELSELVGDYTLSASATYSSDIVKDTTANASISFAIVKEPAKEFSIMISGGADGYDADHLSDEAVYHAMLTYDGQQLSGGALEKVRFTATTTSPQLQCEVAPDEDGYEIRVTPAVDISELTAGDFLLNVEAGYASEEAEDSTASAQMPFAVRDVSSKLEIVYNDPETYYSLIGLKKEEPIEVGLLVDGEPLTEEQMEMLNFNVIAGDLPISYERIPGESAYAVRIDPNGNPPLGSHQISASAFGISDRMGRELSAENSLDISMNRMPKWVRNLLILLGILLLILLIVFILTRPALPNKIDLANIKVTVDGEDLKIRKASVNYPKRGKQREIKISGIGTLKNAKVTMMLTPTKDSYQYLPSARRKAMVVDGTVRVSANVNTLTIGSERFVRGDDNKLARASKSNKNFNFPKGKIGLAGEKEIDGIPADFNIIGDVKFL